jgi:hypothetical protein
MQSSDLPMEVLSVVWKGRQYGHRGAERMGALSLFIYLQILDFLTTILFLKMGLFEASWVVAALIRWSPILGVLAAKLGTVTLGFIAVRYHKDRVMRLANLGYCGVIAWNLICMILAKQPA